MRRLPHDGQVMFNDPLDNREDYIDEVLGRVGIETLVVVDQKRNIGALVLERARSAGMDVAHLPGLPMKRSRGILPGIAKTDEIDAEVIANTAVGMPRTLRSVAESSAEPSASPRRERGATGILLRRRWLCFRTITT